MRPWLIIALVVCLCCTLSGCQSFLYPFISDKEAIEDPRVEGEHDWNTSGEECKVVITKVHPHAYKATVTQPEGRTELLLQLIKIKDQTFFQLSAYPSEPTNHPDDQSGEGMEWAFLNTLTSRPTYLVGKIVSFEPHLRITFFNSRTASQKHFTQDMEDSFKSFPILYNLPGKFDGLVIMPPDKLRKFIEAAADDPDAFVDWGFAK